jgi:hypothetical protein
VKTSAKKCCGLPSNEKNYEKKFFERLFQNKNNVLSLLHGWPVAMPGGALLLALSHGGPGQAELQHVHHRIACQVFLCVHFVSQWAGLGGALVVGSVT